MTLKNLLSKNREAQEFVTAEEALRIMGSETALRTFTKAGVLRHLQVESTYLYHRDTLIRCRRLKSMKPHVLIAAFMRMERSMLEMARRLKESGEPDERLDAREEIRRIHRDVAPF